MKRNYNQPAVQIAQFALESMILAGSAASAGDQMTIGDGETNSQW